MRSEVVKKAATGGVKWVYDQGLSFCRSGMSGVSFPVHRNSGRALVVGGPTNRPQPVALLQQLGLTCAEVDDPYVATAELVKRPLVYRALVISLASVFREELGIIAVVKRKFPHVDVWVTH